MPFFASLWSKNRHYEFATQVADSVSRVAALGLLAASGMVALAAPLVELLFLGGRFSSGDARECAAFFGVFSISMSFWAAQSIYARAFYAAGNTLVPMAAGTAVTVVSWPVYALLYRWHGAMGLAIASDLGIVLQTGTVAFLLHQRRMVSLASLDYREMGRCLMAGSASGAGVWAWVWSVGVLSGHFWAMLQPAAVRWVDVALLVTGSAFWVFMAKWILEITGSALPKVVMKRLGIG
jgi:putative peptidoglycan lipid II flippase